MGGFWDPVTRRPIVPDFDSNDGVGTYLRDYPDVVYKSGNTVQIGITRKEIESLGAGDAFGKVITVFQTTWFVAQCIGRWASRLPTTELEIMTLAFAVLVLINYMIWWHKPLNVRRPVYVRPRPKPMYMWFGDGDYEGPEADVGTCLIKRSMHPVRISITGPEAPVFFQQVAERVVWPLSSIAMVVGSLRSAAEHIKRALKLTVLGVLTYLKHGEEGILNAAFHDAPDPERVSAFFWGAQMLRVDVADPNAAFNVIERTRGDLMVDEITAWSVAIIATIFGAMHCIAWSFPFPSRSERILWRISSLNTTSIPAVVLMIALLGNWIEKNKSKKEWHWILAVVTPVYFFFAHFFALLYVLARVSLVVVAFASLRSMPSGAYCTVSWSSFIPHIE
jgi:hypothetical protein